MLQKKYWAVTCSVAACVFIPCTSAVAGEDCFNGPATINEAQRAQINVPQGHAVRLTFDFNAAWENIVYVCDALTGELILKRGNYRHSRKDWVSPIDNSRSLAYFIVAFHKMVPMNDPSAFKKPWIQSALTLKDKRFAVQGNSGASVVLNGFNDGGGSRSDNAVVTAYFIGTTGVPGAIPASAAATIRTMRRHD